MRGVNLKKCRVFFIIEMAKDSGYVPKMVKKGKLKEERIEYESEGKKNAMPIL